MDIITIRNKKFKVIDGTAFHIETADKVCHVLNNAMKENIRIKLDYGFTSTGKSWNEHGICGYVGRSTGVVKVPLLLHNKRSMGGGSIRDHCVVKISYANKKLGGVLYRHPSYFEKYYALYDTQTGRHMATGLNSKGEKELREALLSYLKLDNTEKEISIIESDMDVRSVQDTARTLDFVVETSDKKFKEED